ncbi:glycosyl transferase family 90 [Owenweeksia hongkongensis]|uniref:glycosyl transferase family 90 n=1 Tax=Owenweeksia hongkongensis TaxID=253245 RepID=UPI003A912975
MNALYYAKSFIYNALPSFFFRWKYGQLKRFEKICDQKELDARLDYYFKVQNKFPIPKEATAVKDVKRGKGTAYFLDLKEFLHYFTKEARFAYYFGDDTNVNPHPTLFKARPIGNGNENSILFKLNKRRHFKWVNDTIPYTEKKDMMVWRGGAYRALRRKMIEKIWDHPLCNVGQTNKPVEDVPWQKEHLPIEEQLKYKIIFCPEGNDVATNLKWVMSSNSLCFMPKPRYETWFMEGALQAGVHYVEVNAPYDDLGEKIEYYSKHTDEAQEIIKNANQHVARFQDEMMEDLLCLKVLERYAECSGQENEIKFRTRL